MASSHCPHCGRRIPQKASGGKPPPASPLDGPPSPEGRYRWGGHTYRFDFGRIVPLLGLRPDAELAEAISSTREHVSKFRRLLDIPPWHPLNGFEKLLGKIPDVEIARRAGCSNVTVQKRRRQMGIPKCPRHVARADARLRAYVEQLEKFFDS